MRKRLLFQVLSVIFILWTIDSCKKDPPVNQIEDASGIKIGLNWFMNHGGVPTDSANLDLYLYPVADSNNAVASSVLDSSFEEIVIPGSIADGDYNLVAAFSNLAGDGSLNVFIKGITVPKSLELRGIVFIKQDEGRKKNLARISKSGNKFLVSKL